MEELIKIIDKDIQDCGREWASYSVDKMYEFQGKLEGKYYAMIDEFSVGLECVYDENYRLIREKLKYNINLLKEKLEVFKALGCKNFETTGSTAPKIQINNNNTNTNTIDISITFEQAKRQVEDMSVLTDSEVEEILSKINALEDIVNSKDRKTKKWENAKEIIKWIAEKGVDVGLTLLPLLLQIK